MINGPSFSQTINAFNGTTNALNTPGTYTVQCTVSGPGGSNVTSPACQTTIVVNNYRAPQCISFTALPSNIKTGGTTLLSRNTANAIAASITVNPGLPGFPLVPVALPAGSTGVTINTMGNYAFSLVLTGQGGQRVICPANVMVTGNVQAPMCYNLSVNPNPVYQGDDVSFDCTPTNGNAGVATLVIRNSQNQIINTLTTN